MAGVIPQALATDSTLISRIGTELSELPVSRRFAGHGHAPDQQTDQLDHRSRMPWIPKQHQKRERKGGQGEGLQLKVPEHF